MTVRARVTIGVIAATLVSVVLIVALAGGSQSSHRRPGPFAWLHPASPPIGWNVAHTSSGAALAYPPGWKPIETDAGTLRIRGVGCLLAAAVQDRPHVCRAMEALLTTLLATPVRECCDRGERPRCCFAIEATGVPAPNAPPS